MRKTKIICTIGPACTDEKILTDMCLAGMNVARLNFSHGSHAEHSERIALLKKVREKLHYPLAILLDTKGPEYRHRQLCRRKRTDRRRCALHLYHRGPSRGRNKSCGELRGSARRNGKRRPHSGLERSSRIRGGKDHRHRGDLPDACGRASFPTGKA